MVFMKCKIVPEDSGPGAILQRTIEANVITILSRMTPYHDITDLAGIWRPQPIIIPAEPESPVIVVKFKCDLMTAETIQTGKNTRRDLKAWAICNTTLSWRQSLRHVSVKKGILGVSLGEYPVCLVDLWSWGLHSDHVGTLFIKDNKFLRVSPHLQGDLMSAEVNWYLPLLYFGLMKSPCRDVFDYLLKSTEQIKIIKLYRRVVNNHLN